MRRRVQIRSARDVIDFFDISEFAGPNWWKPFLLGPAGLVMILLGWLIWPKTLKLDGRPDEVLSGTGIVEDESWAYLSGTS